MSWGFLFEGMFAAVVLGWAFWELYALRREKRKDAEKARAAEDARRAEDASRS